MREVPPRLAAPPLAWIAWWFVPLLLARVVLYAPDHAHFTVFVLLAAQAACNAIAAASALRGLRWAAIAAAAAAANLAALIAIVAYDWYAAPPGSALEWWYVCLPLVANVLLVALARAARPVRF